jgi:ABC-type transport system involved in multi-copper enzyme maturation permease subunit
MRWTPGPIFRQECLRSARRWQTYLARSLFIAALFAAVLVVWWVRVGPFATLSVGTLARVGEPLFYGIVGTQLALVLLAAPASAAGAICVDRTRGTLAHVLVTDVSAAEIVLGKLAARLTWLLGLVAASAPVLALSILLGGVDPAAVLGAYLVTVGVAVLGCCLGLTLSVWGRRTHEVLIVAYLIWLLVLLVHPACWLAARSGAAYVPPWFEYTSPFWLAFAPYLAPGGTDLTEQAVFLGVCLAASWVLVAFAAANLRRVVIAGLSRGEVKPRGRGWRLGLPAPSLDRNPVLWLTCRAGRLTGWTGLAWALYLLLAVAFSAVAGLTRWPPSRLGVPALVNSATVSVGLLFVAIHSAALLADERARRALDVLLTTPLSSAKILAGYWVGAFRPVPLLVVLPVLVVLGQGDRDAGLTAAALSFLIFAYGTALVSIGTAAAVWTSRPGRAVTAAVVVVGLLTAGWITFVATLCDAQPHGIPLAIGSPWYGALLLSGEPAAFWLDQAGEAIVFWGWLYLTLAALLFVATLATFDARVGRSTLPSTGPPLPPPGGRDDEL